MAISCMRSASGHNCRNSLVIMVLAMGQIPRSTERIVFMQVSCVIFNEVLLKSINRPTYRQYMQ